MEKVRKLIDDLIGLGSSSRTAMKAICDEIETDRLAIAKLQAQAAMPTREWPEKAASLSDYALQDNMESLAKWLLPAHGDDIREALARWKKTRDEAQHAAEKAEAAVLKRLNEVMHSHYESLDVAINCGVNGRHAALVKEDEAAPWLPATSEQREVIERFVGNRAPSITSDLRSECFHTLADDMDTLLPVLKEMLKQPAGTGANGGLLKACKDHPSGDSEEFSRWLERLANLLHGSLTCSWIEPGDNSRAWARDLRAKAKQIRQAVALAEKAAM